MSNRYVIKKTDGESFEFGGDTVSVIVSTEDTDGAYSYLHWRVAGHARAPIHVHEFYEETFYVLSGQLDFYLDGDTVPLKPGDFARAPAGCRHGYSNPSGDAAELLVTFSPGGMEQVFLAHRTEGRELDLESYLTDARRIHKTEYELGE